MGSYKETSFFFFGNPLHAVFCTEDVKPFPSLPSMILSVEEDKALVGPVTLAVQNQEGWRFQPVVQQVYIVGLCQEGPIPSVAGYVCGPSRQGPCP